MRFKIQRERNSSWALPQGRSEWIPGTLFCFMLMDVLFGWSLLLHSFGTILELHRNSQRQNQHLPPVLHRLKEILPRTVRKTQGNYEMLKHVHQSKLFLIFTDLLGNFK